jgi:hypothetical protein
MVEESDGVLVLKDTKAIVFEHNLAEGAIFVKRVGLRAHIWAAARDLDEELVKLVPKK